MAGVAKVELQLSNGQTVTVAPLLFGALREVREAFLRLVTEKCVATIISVASGPLATALRERLAAHEQHLIETGEAVEFGPADLLKLLDPFVAELKAGSAEAIAGVARDLFALSDSFVRGCLRGTVDLDELTAQEFLDIRDKAIELTDLPRLLEQEKNYCRGVATAAMKLCGMTSGSPGESATST